MTILQQMGEHFNRAFEILLFAAGGCGLDVGDGEAVDGVAHALAGGDGLGGVLGLVAGADAAALVEGLAVGCGLLFVGTAAG